MRADLRTQFGDGEAAGLYASPANREKSKICAVLSLEWMTGIASAIAAKWGHATRVKTTHPGRFRGRGYRNSQSTLGAYSLMANSRGVATNCSSVF